MAAHQERRTESAQPTQAKRSTPSIGLNRCAVGGVKFFLKWIEVRPSTSEGGLAELSF